MASTAQNNFSSGPRLAETAPISTATSINQGDLLKIASNLALPVAAVGDTVHGMADETNPASSLLDTTNRTCVLRPGNGVNVKLPLKSGDSVNYDDLVYISSNVATNPQEISTSSGGGAAKVGRVRELAAVTGDGSTRILVEFLGAAA